MKNSRLFRILYILLENNTITAPELAKMLEVSVRTIYRDVDALSQAGIPVCTAAGKGGGISLMPGYTFHKAMLSDDEQNQILFAIQSLQAADQNVGFLLSKLGTVFQKTNTSWIEVDFSRWGFHHIDNGKFERLKRAILEKHILHIHYCGASGAISERDIKPFKLIFEDKSWYLQAYCQTAEDLRLFKISRIMELTLCDVHFTDDFTIIPPLEDDSFPAFETATLKLRLSPSVAFRVYDEFDPSRVTKQPDGSFVVTADFPMDGWVYSYLLSFGTQVEILEPAYLKTNLAGYAKKISEHHKS